MSVCLYVCMYVCVYIYIYIYCVYIVYILCIYIYIHIHSNRAKCRTIAVTIPTGKKWSYPCAAALRRIRSTRGRLSTGLSILIGGIR